MKPARQGAEGGCQHLPAPAQGARRRSRPRFHGQDTKALGMSRYSLSQSKASGGIAPEAVLAGARAWAYLACHLGPGPRM